VKLWPDEPSVGSNRRGACAHCGAPAEYWYGYDGGLGAGKALSCRACLAKGVRDHPTLGFYVLARWLDGLWEECAGYVESLGIDLSVPLE
jgi:hypothetical protein